MCNVKFESLIPLRIERAFLKHSLFSLTFNRESYIWISTLVLINRFEISGLDHFDTQVRAIHYLTRLSCFTLLKPCLIVFPLFSMCSCLMKNLKVMFLQDVFNVHITVDKLFPAWLLQNLTCQLYHQACQTSSRIWSPLLQGSNTIVRMVTFELRYLLNSDLLTGACSLKYGVI